MRAQAHRQIHAQRPRSTTRASTYPTTSRRMPSCAPAEPGLFVVAVPPSLFAYSTFSFFFFSPSLLLPPPLSHHLGRVCIVQAARKSRCALRCVFVCTCMYICIAPMYVSVSPPLLHLLIGPLRAQKKKCMRRPTASVSLRVSPLCRRSSSLFFLFLWCLPARAPVCPVSVCAPQHLHTCSCLRVDGDDVQLHVHTLCFV